MKVVIALIYKCQARGYLLKESCVSGRMHCWMQFMQVLRSPSFGDVLCLEDLPRLA